MSNTNLKILEKLINAEQLNNIEIVVKKGIYQLAFLLREAERKPEKENIIYDVTNYTEAQLKTLISNYQAYYTFGNQNV